MRIQVLVPAIGVLFATGALGQQATTDNVERTLQFARTTATLDFQEAVTMIRTITEIRDVTADPVQRTLTLRAPADRIAIADWLLRELDNPAGLPPGRSREFNIGDSTLRLYRVANASTVQEFQEMATMVRTISDIRQAYTLSTPRILGLRGGSGQMAMTEWLLQEIDQPLTQARVAHEFFVPNSSDDVMRVFYFPLTTSVQEFQETAVEIRKATGIRRAYTYNAARAFVVRGTIDQIAQAASMARR